MKFIEPWERQRLCFLLDKATSREGRMWRGFMPKRASSQNTDVSPAQRDEAVRWLTELHGQTRLYPETLVLAVNILDRFLSAIKARPKYLRCIAITCFFLAAKTSEEDECVPSLKHLANSSGCGCSPSDVRRMERIVLDKLHWDLHTATALDFLHIFHAMVLLCRGSFLESVLELKLSERLAALTQKLYLCLADHSLLQLRGSMLALALVTLELETCGPDWLSLTIELLRKTQMDSSELIRSRELVACCLSTPRCPLPTNTVYIYLPPTPPPGSCPVDLSRDQAPAAVCTQPQSSAAGKECPQLASSSSIRALVSPNKLLIMRCKNSAKRKVDDMEVDDFFADIKRLYNEELSVQEAGLSLGSSPCPALQPISAP